MKYSATLLALGIATAVLAADAVKPQLTVLRVRDRPTIEGPAANFTGKAKIDRQVRPEDSRPLGSMVSFEPGARTAWHTHPLGQDAAMSHYTIVEPLNGSSAQWMEKVTDEHYASEEASPCKTPRT